MALDLARVRSALRPLVEGKKVLLATEVAAGAMRWLPVLEEYGARRPLVLVDTLGTGETPGPADAEVVVMEARRARDILEGSRAYVGRLATLPAKAREALDEWDPDGEAIVIGTPHTDLPGIAGRPWLGRRRPAWLALEDKSRADAVWDAAGVARAPAAVAAVGAEAVAAAKRLDEGAGTVWAGDAREGFNGGALYVRWVRTAEDVAAAMAFYSLHCDRVRVMPFLEGLPCSIHGLVLPDGVAVFRPVEIVTLRKPRSRRFLYGGVATWWDPPESDRETMRRAARAVGGLLAAKVGYRGAFGVDGILTAGGWLPNELNTRSAAGLETLASSLPDLPFGLLDAALREGRETGASATDLEDALLSAADRNRVGGGWTTVAAAPDRERSAKLAWDGSSFSTAAEGEPAAGEIRYGPSTVGGFVRFRPDPEATPAGPSLAPRVAAALRAADELFGTAIGELVHAPDPVA